MKINNVYIGKFEKNGKLIPGIWCDEQPENAIISEIRNYLIPDENKILKHKETEILYDTIDDSVDEYIIFEDIISHGRSVNALVNELTKKGKKVLAIYSLILNDAMKNYKLDNEYMDIYYTNKINQKQWVNFIWENGYIDK